MYVDNELRLSRFHSITTAISFINVENFRSGVVQDGNFVTFGLCLTRLLCDLEATFSYDYTYVLLCYSKSFFFQLIKHLRKS